MSSLLGEAAAHRGELAGIELTEARVHVQTSVVLLGLAAFFTLLGGMAVTLTFMGLVWESPHRAWWLGGMCAVYVGTAVIAAFSLRRRLHTWRPFAETRNQLQQDHQCLTRLIQALLP